MHCHICDARLTPDEIKYEEDHQRYAPCRTCIEASGTTKVRKSDIEILEALLESQGAVDEPASEAGETPLS